MHWYERTQFALSGGYGLQTGRTWWLCFSVLFCSIFVSLFVCFCFNFESLSSLVISVENSRAVHLESYFIPIHEYAKYAVNIWKTVCVGVIQIPFQE